MRGALYLAGGSTDEMLASAQEFTPRVEICGPGELLLDLSGLTRLFGDPHALARELQRAASARGLRAAVALAGTGTAARLLARSSIAPPSPLPPASSTRVPRPPPSRRSRLRGWLR